MVLDVTTLGDYVGTALGVGSFVGGLLLSFLFLLGTLLFVSRLSENSTVLMATGVMSVMLSAGLSWVPVWVPILIVMIVAIQYGNVAQRMLGGGE